MIIKILRWIAFLPVSFILIAFANLVMIWVASKFPWWGTLILFVSFLPLSIFSVAAVLLSPVRQIGALLFIVITILYEIGLITNSDEIPSNILFWIILLALKLILDAWNQYRFFGILKQAGLEALTAKDFID